VRGIIEEENEKGIGGGGVGLSMQKGRELMHGRRWERGFNFESNLSKGIPICMALEDL